jgi:hydroxypyruvate isomerase
MRPVAANLTLLFPDTPMLDRPAHAASAGFDGVEILFPYDHPAADWQRALALPVALINTPPGDWAAGERGFAAVPGQTARFRDGFRRAQDYAAALGAGAVHVMSGVAAGPEAEAAFCDNLLWAAGQAPGLALTIEVLNPTDMPGYFLNGFDQAAALLDRLAVPGLGLQFDLWHAHRLHGDPGPVWARHGARATHVQFAGLNGRHEPGLTELALLARIRAGGYAGWMAAEYVADSGDLSWLDAGARPA